MPRTSGRNQVHVSQVMGWTEVDRQLVEIPRRDPSALDPRIAARVVERIPNGATIQVGIGSFPTHYWPASATTPTSACIPSCSPTR